MSATPTIKIRSDHFPFVLINEDEFDAARHVIYGGQETPPEPVDGVPPPPRRRGRPPKIRTEG